MEKNADGDVLMPGLPPVVIAVPFMCVLLAGSVFGLKNGPEIQILKGLFGRVTSLE